MKINDKDYKEISSTAIVTAYPRIYTDIPYSNDIYKWLENNCKEEVVLNKNLAPDMEARYKLINNLLDKYKIKQVIELAAGYSSRGLIYAKKEYNYIELDLDNVINNKINILNTIEKSIPKNLHFIKGNALKCKDISLCKKYLDRNQEITIINEGLLRYLTFDEKKMVAKNIYNLLSLYGGIWITSDLTPKKFIESQNKALNGFNTKLSDMTSRNKINDRFENIEHIKNFFGDIGFEILEIHKFIEIKDQLISINKYDIYDSNIKQTLEDAIVVVMKINK